MSLLLVAPNLDASKFTPPALHVLRDVLRESGIRESEAPIVAPWAARAAIAHRKPNLVVAMGDAAAREVIPNWEGSATTHRGYLFVGVGGTKVLVTVHPEDARRSWVPFRVLLGYDMERAKTEANSPKLDRPTREVIIVS